LLRRLASADAEIKRGNYTSCRTRMLADNLSGLHGLLIGIIGFGRIGRAVAQAFRNLGAESDTSIPLLTLQTRKQSAPCR
jgi:phosphoglycerate dehydrogenase-like enzyme